MQNTWPSSAGQCPLKTGTQGKAILSSGPSSVASGPIREYKNGAMPHSMTESFPPAEGFTATEEGASPEMKEALLNPYAKQGRG